MRIINTKNKMMKKEVKLLKIKFQKYKRKKNNKKNIIYLQQKDSNIQ